MPASSPRISVVLPVYNGEKYLFEAIDSILAQTFTDFELIMIDDGSTDTSPDILRAYEKKDPRVRVIVRENLGLVATLNQSIGLAQGEWIARMDQDDIALAHRFSRQLEWLKKTKADISGSWVKRFGSSDKREVRLPETDGAIKKEMLFCSPFAHPAVMMKAELVRELKYDKAFEKAEDYDLWERAAEAGWKMTNVPEVLLFYRVHNAQISSITLNLQKKVAQQVRQRYWRFVGARIGIDNLDAQELIRVDDAQSGIIRLDSVDRVLARLLNGSSVEENNIVLKHARRLYLSVAKDHKDIIVRWHKLMKDTKQSSDSPTLCKLWLFSCFQIGRHGKLFPFLKKIHTFFVRKT